MKRRDNPIVIIGFMGAGKSTVAAGLAERLGCKMVDLDELLEGQQGRSIAEVINAKGEAWFRRLESDALVTVLRNTWAGVIALGGGTWTSPDNRAVLQQVKAVTVWLDTPFELCWRRICESPNLRPLARDESSALELFSARLPVYALADVRVECDDGVELGVTVDTIINAVALTAKGAATRAGGFK